MGARDTTLKTEGYTVRALKAPTIYYSMIPYHMVTGDKDNVGVTGKVKWGRRREELTLVIGQISRIEENSVELEGSAGISQAAERTGQVGGTVRKQ